MAPPLVTLIDTRQGTDSDSNFSTGNALPLVTVPHGAIGWVPQTHEGRWIFDRRAAKIQGFRATRQPSPWVGDYGDFLILVSSGSRPLDSIEAAESSYPASECVARPDWFRVQLQRHGIVAEITPTAHGACFRFTFTRSAAAWVAFVPAQGRVEASDRRRGEVLGYSTSNQGGAPANFKAHFCARVEARVLEARALQFSPELSPNAPVRLGLWLKLRRPSDGVVTLRIGTSLISAAQARLNLERELAGVTFEHVRERATQSWQDVLGVIELEGATAAQRQTFYRCLHRCLVFPRRIDEFNAAGERVHYSPFDGKIREGPLFTDCGFWDGYRALFPLLSLIAPAVLNEMIVGWLNVFKEGGWLPNWASPGYREGMVGSHGPVVIADAWLKGIRDFDAPLALDAMLRDAHEESRSSRFGRLGGAHYARQGYVAADLLPHSVARTLDYAHGDFAVESFARAIGREAEADALKGRDQNYRRVFDPRTGFFRARLSTGKWARLDSPFNWSRDFIEGNAWHYRWSVPHDPKGLIELHGGARAFVRKLDELFSLPPHFESDFYPREIHEMTEMAAVPFGQYAHCNEPVHHVPYLYSWAGRPDRTQYWVRRVVDELYSPERYAGDEDNGAMSAWYVLSTIGLFQLTGGRPSYVLGAPRFPGVTIQPCGGRPFRIATRNGRPPPPYVRAVWLNGRPHHPLELAHAEIARGGELEFAMTNNPVIAAARGQSFL